MPIWKKESALIEYSNQPMLNKTIFLFLLTSQMVFGQLPSTNIYHFDFIKSASKYTVSNPKFLTNFNAEGYNNQPFFFEDDVAYFTTNYYGDQTEIAKFDFFDNILTRITYTPESEYSPTLIPGKEDFSCVRVEQDGETQTLSVYPSDGIGIAKRYMHNTKNIGYHAWLENMTLALFLVEAPDHNLAIADAISERRSIILDKIGRTLKVTPDNKLLFIHKISELEWLIKSYNPDTNKSKILAQALPKVEDFELLSDGNLISGSGSKLYVFKTGQSKAWEEVIDLKDIGVKNISRLTVRKKRLLIVDNG